MKHVTTALFLVGLSLTVSTDVLAQPYVSATYAVCDINRESRADQIVEQVAAGILDAQVAAGTITAWGWLAHHGGGYWRRALYTIGNDLGDLDMARDAFVNEFRTEHSSAAGEFSSICGRHEDYVWSRVTGSQPAAQLASMRPQAGLSVYMECDWSKGDRVDELVGIIGQTASKMVADKRINSWGFLSHVFGGKYARLFLIDGASNAANLEAIHDMGNAMAAEHGEAFTEFMSLCHTHQDYMWDIKMARP